LTPALTPEQREVETTELGARVALVAAGAFRLGCNLTDVLELVSDAWTLLARKRVAAASAAGRTAQTRRGPVRKKGRRS
jgi:hypothetical protein